jgi:hypothetical protein
MPQSAAWEEDVEDVVGWRWWWARVGEKSILEVGDTRGLFDAVVSTLSTGVVFI